MSDRAQEACIKTSGCWLNIHHDGPCEVTEPARDAPTEARGIVEIRDELPKGFHQTATSPWSGPLLTLHPPCDFEVDTARYDVRIVPDGENVRVVISPRQTVVAGASEPCQFCGESNWSNHLDRRFRFCTKCGADAPEPPEPPIKFLKCPHGESGWCAECSWVGTGQRRVEPDGPVETAHDKMGDSDLYVRWSARAEWNHQSGSDIAGHIYQICANELGKDYAAARTGKADLSALTDWATQKERVAEALAEGVKCTNANEI